MSAAWAIFHNFLVWEMLSVDHGTGQFSMTAHMASEHRATKNFYKMAMCNFHKFGKCKLRVHCRHAYTEDALHKTPMEAPTYQQPGWASFKQQAHGERMQTPPVSVDRTSNRGSLALSKARKASHLASISMDFDQQHPASMCMESNQHAQSMSMYLPQ